ncbi:hypothetical protein [Paenarthrobacter nitroguajacolicus]|nr:hypothetical protein [Paenarthrobacter nitroguajacolicus]
MKRLARHIAIARPNATPSRVASVLPAAIASTAFKALTGTHVLAGTP